MAKKKAAKKKKIKKKKPIKKTPTEEPWIVAIDKENGDNFLIGTKSQVKKDLLDMLEMESSSADDQKAMFENWEFHVIDRTRKVEVELEFEPDLWIGITKRGES